MDEDEPIYVRDRLLYQKLKALGFNPAVVADIGASNGRWSDQIASIFPDAEYHLFEPCVDLVAKYRARLKPILAQRQNFKFHQVALGDRTGEISIAITPDGVGSTTLDMAVSEYFPRKATVSLTTLDTLIEQKVLPSPQLIKIDVQASEDQILRGAAKALKSAEVLAIECWLQKSYGPETPLLWEISTYLAEFGFYLAETGDHYYDSLHCLIALDCYFVRRDIAESWKELLTNEPW